MSYIGAIPTYCNKFLFATLYIVTSQIVIPKIALQHFVWNIANLRSTFFLSAQFLHLKSSKLTTIDLHRANFIGTVIYWLEKKFVQYGRENLPLANSEYPNHQRFPDWKQN